MGQAISSRVIGLCLVTACSHAQNTEPPTSENTEPPASESDAPAPNPAAPDEGGALAPTEAGADAGAPPGQVPIFVAQGDLGRTTISCDDGRTWIANHSWDIDGDPLMCGTKQPGVRCDTGTCQFLNSAGQCIKTDCCVDTPGMSKGVVYGNGQFVATWGHGMPGEIRRSANGGDWTTTWKQSYFGGLAFGDGRFVASANTPVWSADGLTWTKTKDLPYVAGGRGSTVVRRTGYGDYDGGGRFVSVFTDPTGIVASVSSDDGETWWRPDAVPGAQPAGCVGEMGVSGGIVAGNGVLIMVTQAGSACRSTDGGSTWTLGSTGLDSVLSHGVWTGTEFLFWGASAQVHYMVASPDGAAWTKTKTDVAVDGPIARSASGTLVAFNPLWRGYEVQQFMRSTDGVTWEKLPTTAFVQSHPIYYATFGYADPSACAAH